MSMCAQRILLITVCLCLCVCVYTCAWDRPWCISVDHEGQSVRNQFSPCNMQGHHTWQQALFPTEPSHQPLQRGLKCACCTEKISFTACCSSQDKRPGRQCPKDSGAKLRLGSKFSHAQACSSPRFHLASVKKKCDYNLKQRLNKLNVFQVDCLLFFKLIIIHVNSNDFVIFGRRGRNHRKKRFGTKKRWKWFSL